MKKIAFISSLFIATVLWSSASSADSFIKVGLLKCIKSGKGINILIHSQFPVRCLFKDTSGGKEKYRGKTGVELGLDLQKLEKSKMVFTVLSVGDLKAGKKSLAGRYLGGTINLTVDVGAGVNALVGGGKNHIALQPIALESTRGIGAAAGIGFLDIH
tara:strand:+ start:6945 stop:7418 length:474 start_codon:yes stop_codon:yes gene_type:complete